MAPRSRAAPDGAPCEPPGAPVTIERIPKPDGGHRALVRLGADDGWRYAAAVLAVLPEVERALASTVFANRAMRTEGAATGRAILEPWPTARARYLRAVRAAGSVPGRAWFVGDVADCYGSITPRVVGRALRSMGVDPRLTTGIETLLRSFEDRGVRGLPIGPAPSAVLANAVLASVDHAVARAAGAPALRWVDDVVVVAPRASRARAAEAAYERSLRKIGLRPHPVKTRVVEDHRPLLEAPSGAPAPPGSSVA
ncbi:MAG: RNA-directed DNA polymerase [Actinomycetota bacterium]